METILSDPILRAAFLFNLLILWPTVRILTRAGYTWRWAAALLLPLLGPLIIMGWLALRPWPGLPPRPAPPPLKSRRDLRSSSSASHADSP